MCRRLACLLLTAALLAASGVAPARADVPEAVRTQADAALRRLDSPALLERRAAVRDLVELMPGVRTLIVEALPRASWRRQMHLIEVLAQDGSEEAVAALLRHLGAAEGTQAVLVQSRLAQDPATAERLLAAWRRDADTFLGRAGTAPLARRRMADLARLLRRAEIESLFLARKSKTGSTGYYKGQYDVLQGRGREADYRRHALEVVAGIALDEAVPTAGVFRSGVYRFVRTHHVDEWELKGMALNAVAELCTREDKDVIARLEQHLAELMLERAELYDRMQVRYAMARGDRWDDKPFQDALMEWSDALGDYLDVLACLHQIEPERYDGFVERFIDELRGFNWPFRPPFRNSYIAGLLIRVGWYERAIDAYRTAMDPRLGGGSKVLGYYNMACAAASASRRTGLSERRKAFWLDRAVEYLDRSVNEGWSDVAWMDEDRDLDPIREHRQRAYLHIVEKAKAALRMPDEEKRDGR